MGREKPPKSWEKQPNELDSEWYAFRYYRDHRPLSLTDVSRDLCIPIGTVNSWSADYYWHERTNEFDQHRDRIRTQAAESVLQKNARLHAETADLALKLAGKELRKRISENTSRDMTDSSMVRLFEAAVKVHRLITGESTDNLKIPETYDLSKLSNEQLKELERLQGLTKTGEA